MSVRFMTAQVVNGYEDSSMFILNTKDVGETLPPGFNESQMFILNTRDSSVSEIIDGFGSSSAFILNTRDKPAAARLAGVASFSESTGFLLNTRDSDDLNLLGAADSTLFVLNTHDLRSEITHTALTGSLDSTPFILNTKVEGATGNKTSRGSQSSSGFVLNTRDYEPTIIAIFTAYGDTLTFILDTRSSTNPEEDSDKDGIPDSWEIEHGFDKDVANTYLDPDGDGLNNLQEYLLGSDPNDGNSGFAANADRDRETGNFTVTWKSSVGRSYTVQVSDDFATWTDLSGPHTASGPFTSAVLEVDSDVKRSFFRIVLQN